MPPKVTISENEFKVEEEQRKARFEAALARIQKGESEEEDLSTCSVQEEHAKKLAEALKVNNKLTKLDLYDNELGDEGLKALSECFRANKTLRVLNLKWNGLGKLNQIGAPDNDSGVKMFAKALQENKTLEQINLEWNQIWEDGRKMLATLRSKTRHINADDGLPNSGYSVWNFVNPPKRAP